MRKLARIFLASTLGLAAAAAVHANTKTELSKAEEVIKQARAALGGDSKLGTVQSLSIKGKFRRVIQEREMSGEREFDFLLPDKYMRTETIFMQGMGASVANTRALTGGEVWSSGGGRGGGVIMIRSDGGQPTPEDKERAAKEQVRQMRAEMARYVLALLLTQPADFPLQFTYAGEATADDGSADVIDAAGPDGFSARLFIDKQTHLPLMLTYRAPKPRVFTMSMQQGHGSSPQKTPEELAKEAQEKMKAEGPPKAEEVEMQWRFSEYREAGGLLLPHRITAGSDGETNEEFEIKSYTVNPQFKTDKFQKK